MLRRGEWAPGVSDPQDVAPATDDVVATARAARAAGPLLPVPENYHDDLEARLELPAERLAAFRALGVLCEADTGGAYLQECTGLLAGACSWPWSSVSAGTTGSAGRTPRYGLRRTDGDDLPAC